MTNTKRPYTGFDKIGRSVPPGVEKFMDLLNRRWGLTNLGILTVRAMRSAPAQFQNKNAAQLEKLPDYKKWMSVHATGRAIDAGYSNRKTALEAWEWCLAHATELGIEEIHDYFYAGPAGQWGRGWRCNRNGVAGWKIYDANDNAGTPGGQWVHIEISPAMAADEKKAYDIFKAEFEKYLGQKKVEDYLRGLAEEAKKKEEEEKKLSKEEREKRKKNREAAEKALKEKK